MFEDNVPFVRHPWTIDGEDTAWESNLIRGAGRVVLPKAENVKVRFRHNKNEAFAFEGSDSAAEWNGNTDNAHSF